MKAWHDYHISGYTVDSIKRDITFNLVLPGNGVESKMGKVVFKSVHGYELQNDAMASIILYFEEMGISNFLEIYGGEIEKSFSQNGCYGEWASDLSDAQRKLEEMSAKAYILSSSIGLEGWLLAEEVIEENA